MKIALIFISVIAVLASILCILFSKYGKTQTGKVECENTYVNFIKEFSTISNILFNSINLVANNFALGSKRS